MSSFKSVLPKFDTVLLTIVRYGIYFSAFTPLIIFRNSFSPFNFGKVIVFRILIEILLACYLPLAIKYPDLRPKFSRLSLALILFTFSFALSSILGVNFLRSFWGSMERMGGLFTFLHLIALFLMATAVLKKRADWVLLFKLSVLASFVSAIYALVQKSGLEFKYLVGTDVIGTIGNRAIFSGYLLFNIYFALWLLIDSLKIKIKKIISFQFTERVFYILIIFIDSLALLYASIRSSTLALFLSFSLFFVLLFIFREKLGFYQKIQWKHFFIILFLGVVFLFFYQTILVAEVVDKFPILGRLASTTFAERPVETRLLVWRQSIPAILEKPLFGWGPENFIVPFGQYFNPKLFIGPETELVFDRAHNLFLDATVAQGLIGLFLFCLLIGLVLFFSLKTARQKGDQATFFAFPPLLLAYLSHTFFIFDLLPTYLMLFYVFGFVAAMSRPAWSHSEVRQVADRRIFLRSSAPPRSAQDDRKWVNGVFVLLLFSALSLAYFVNIKPALADYLGTRGALDLAHDQYRTGVDKFKEALSDKTFVWQDIFTNFVHFYMTAIYRLEGKILEKDLAQDLEDLEKNSQQALAKNPRDFNLYLYAESIYLAQGSFLDPDKYLPQAENVLKKGLVEYPRLHYFYQRLAYIKSLQKDYDAALFYVQKSYEANPEFPGTKYLLGRTYIIKGEKEKGFNLAIEAIIDDGFRKEDSIIWLAMRLAEEKEYEKLVYLYTKLSYLQEQKYLTQLAYSYYLWDKKEKARQIADEALAVPVNVLGYANLKVLAEIYDSLGEKEKLDFVLEELKTLLPPSKPREIWIPVEGP